jgi:translin
MDAYGPIARRLGRSLLPLDRAREAALRDARELIRLCSALIRGLHRAGWDAPLGRRADRLARGIGRLMRDHPFLAFHGALLQALGEYAEARLLRAHLQGRPVPTPQALGLPAGAYLYGLADLVGELRRHVLARLLVGDLPAAQGAFDSMEKAYEALHECPAPETLVPLRSKVDAARGIVERTRGELVTAKRAKDLERKMDDVGRLLDEAEAGRTKRAKRKPDDELDLDGAWGKS